MSKLSTPSANQGKIAFIEGVVNDYLIQSKSPLSFIYWHLQVLPSDFNRLINFYYPSIYIQTIIPLEVGQRVQFIELDICTLNPSGRSCFRFIKSINSLPALLSDDIWYDLELSIIQVLKN
jgi:hypothetical protein